MEYDLSSKGMVCPQCGNQDLQVTTETQTHTSGSNFSASKGCLGYLLLGPLGILCGSCGQGQKTTSSNSTYWVCPKCGKKFRDITELQNEIKKNSFAAKTFLIVQILIFIILGIFMYLDTNSSYAILPGIIIFILMLLIDVFIVLPINKKAKQELNEILSGMDRFR